MSPHTPFAADISPSNGRDLDGQCKLVGIVAEDRVCSKSNQVVTKVLWPVLVAVREIPLGILRLASQEVLESDELCWEALEEPRARLPEVLLLGVRLEALARLLLAPFVLHACVLLVCPERIIDRMARRPQLLKLLGGERSCVLVLLSLLLRVVQGVLKPLSVLLEYGISASRRFRVPV